MKMEKSIGFVLWMGLLLIGCATTRPVNSIPEKASVQIDSSEKSDVLEGKLIALEQYLSDLRSEMTDLENRLENIQAHPQLLVFEGKLIALEQSISNLRSEMTDLENRLKNIQVRPRLLTYRLPREVYLCGERFPLEDQNVWENLNREFLITMDSEAQVLLWMKRAKRYFPHIEKRLNEMGLPEDLKYLTITESSLRPYAISPTGASGIWQFISSTGEKYGMKRNQSLDERFDFFKATEGALAYLKTLYEEFKSWAVSMAAYNAGENRVRKEIEIQKTNNYFYLDLPLETERYVYKIVVAKIVLSDPEKFGFHLEDDDFYSPLQVERVQIELTKPLPIIEVARAIGAYYKQLKELNLHFSEENIPAGIHFLNLPSGTSDRFWNFFSTWKKNLDVNK